jgi:hypothetical protein
MMAARTRRSVAALLCGAFALSPMRAAHPQSSDASREQCTCDIPGHSERTGAQVVNAASCVLERRYPWCNIYLATTENSQAHAVLLSTLRDIPAQGGEKELVEFLGRMFQRYLEATAKTEPESAAVRVADARTIEAIIPKSFGMISRCIVSFGDRKTLSEEGEEVTCSVGRESGWLRIEFEIEGRRYAFLFSPNGAAP